MDIPPKPSWLQTATVKQGLIGFHAEMVQSAKDFFDQQYRMEIELHEVSTGTPWNAEASDAYRKRLAEAKWEDGSITAMMRDRMAFHEAALEFLTNAG